MDQFAKLPDKKQNSDNKHRLFQILSQIKESISKRRYNHAFEMGSKYYEQNKTLLTNEEIYQLCWKCCITIENKIHHRLTVRKKKYVPPITQTHIQHLFSLQMSLHSIVLPEIVKLNQNHFNMLQNKNEVINPKEISRQYMVFQRKSKDYFFSTLKVQQEMKRLIKQHLKICNTVLMYKIQNRKNLEELEEHFKTIEQIYEKFQEHDFPSEHMDFMLIKLSFIQVEGSCDKIKCQFRLPLGFLSKLYLKIRKDKEAGIQHYLNKLASFFVLSLRHITMSVQDIYILSSQIQYITKVLSDKYENAYSRSYTQHNKLGLTVKRLITIDKEQFQDNMQRVSKRQESVSTYNRLSEKKMESKQSIKRAFNALRSLAEVALHQINAFVSSRRETIQIVLKYFTQSYLEKSRAKDDELIQNEVLLNKKLKRKTIIKQNYQENETASQKPARRNAKTLTAMLREIRLQKKTSSVQDATQAEKVRFRTTTKQQGKFIIRNMQKVHRKSELKIGYFKDVDKLLRLVQSQQKKMAIQQVILAENSEIQDFQLQRLNKIKSFKEKLRIKSCKQDANIIQSKEILYQKQMNKEKQQKKINLLNDVVQKNIKTLLQLPNSQTSNKNYHNSSSLANKLQVLKNQTENLNTERKLLVQRLMNRKNQCFQYFKSNHSENLEFPTHKQMNREQQNQQQLAQYSENFKAKIKNYVENNKNLMRIGEKSSFNMMGQEKANTKLKLDKKANKKTSEITFQNVQSQYKKLQGTIIQDQKTQWSMALSSQFDKLRRDAAKNQFVSQNERKLKADKMKPINNTIYQITLDEEQDHFY